MPKVIEFPLNHQSKNPAPRHRPGRAHRIRDAVRFDITVRPETALKIIALLAGEPTGA